MADRSISLDEFFDDRAMSAAKFITRLVKALARSTKTGTAADVRLRMDGRVQAQIAEDVNTSRGWQVQLTPGGRLLSYVSGSVGYQSGLAAGTVTGSDGGLGFELEVTLRNAVALELLDANGRPVNEVTSAELAVETGAALQAAA